MKSVEQFGRQLVRYEGVSDVSLGTKSGEINFAGYFEAAQFPNGRLTVNIVPTHRPSPTGNMSSGDSSIQLSFNGETLDGWTITCSGQNNFSPFNWILAPMVRQPTERSFSPQYLVAKRKDASVDGYSKAQFLVCNLLWDDISADQPEAIELKVLGYSVSIQPIENYMDVGVGLRNSHGIEPTALVTIEIAGETREQLECFKNLMDDLVFVLRLATGNLVQWYYGESSDERTQTPVERIHQQALTRPYSGTVKFRPLRSGYESAIPKINLQEIADAFFDKSNHVLCKDSLKGLINQFTNTCDQTNYLETNGLLASALTDLLTSKLAHQRRTSEAIPQAEFETVHLPLLQESIDKTAWPSRVKTHLKNSVQGGYRASFRQRLRGLNRFLSIGLKESHIKRIVDARNSLVHEGTYKSTFEEGHWSDDYHLLVWTNLCTLCRLTGFEGELPTFLAGSNVEV